jgi:hypothetical protein
MMNPASGIPGRDLFYEERQGLCFQKDRGHFHSKLTMQNRP